MGFGAVAIQKAEKVIRGVEDGISLGSALDLADLSPSTFAEVLQSVRELAVRYARARELRADVEADEAKDIADDPTLDPQHAKNRIDIRKWRASKHNSKVYGDRVDLNVQQSINIGDALNEARGRLIAGQVPVLPPALDVPVIESKAAEPAGPDIFS